MHVLLIINISIAVLIVLLLILLSWIWPPDSPWSPWWTTNRKISRKICKLAGLTRKDKFYELGSGEGTTVIVAAKEFGADCVGIEIDPARNLIAKIRITLGGLSKKITLKRTNFFKVNLSEATVVYAYLVPKALLRLKPKFDNELRPGTLVVSFHYPIPYYPMIKEDKKDQLFLYRVPKKKKPTS
jgi:hypothetical protein